MLLLIFALIGCGSNSMLLFGESHPILLQISTCGIGCAASSVPRNGLLAYGQVFVCYIKHTILWNGDSMHSSSDGKGSTPPKELIEEIPKWLDVQVKPLPKPDPGT